MKTARTWCEYKGKKYVVLWAGQTRYGRRAHLQFGDGSKDFWVDESKIRILAALATHGQTRPSAAAAPVVEEVSLEELKSRLDATKTRKDQTGSPFVRQPATAATAKKQPVARKARKPVCKAATADEADARDTDSYLCPDCGFRVYPNRTICSETSMLH